LVYVLNQDTQVTIQLFDLLGGLVREWVSEAGMPGGQAGTNEIVWDGTNGAGRKVAAGAYLAVLRASAAGASTRVVRKIGVIH